MTMSSSLWLPRGRRSYLRGFRTWADSDEWRSSSRGEWSDGFDRYLVGCVPMIADVVTAWVVPAIIFVVVIVACLLGLRWLRTEHLEELRSVPLFSGLSDHELLWVLRTARAESFPPGTHHHPRGRHRRRLLHAHGMEP